MAPLFKDSFSLVTLAVEAAVPVTLLSMGAIAYKSDGAASYTCVTATLPFVLIVLETELDFEKDSIYEV